ncbi:hypothetical protein EP7_004306 [Isosphaeraceae bacterium EP7]
MIEDQWLEMLARIFEFYRVQVTHTLVEEFMTEFENIPASIVYEGFRNWRAADTKGFPPHVGMISREVNKILFPALSRPFSEASRTNPLRIKAERRAGIRPVAYNPWGDGGPTTYESKRMGEAAAEIYEQLQEESLGKTTQTLLREVLASGERIALKNHLASLGVTIKPHLKLVGSRHE